MNRKERMAYANVMAKMNMNEREIEQLKAENERLKVFAREEEYGYSFTYEGALVMGLLLAFNNETDATNLDKFSMEIVKYFDDRKRRIHEAILEDNEEVMIFELLNNKDSKQQVLYLIRLLSIVARNTASNTREETRNEINELNATIDKLNKSLSEANIVNRVSIDREIKATEELNKCKRKHDKEVRVLEHKIQELEKELEKLRDK